MTLNLLQEGFCNFPLIIPLLYRYLQWMGLILGCLQISSCLHFDQTWLKAYYKCDCMLLLGPDWSHFRIIRFCEGYDYRLLQLGCQVGILELNLLQVGFCNFPFIRPLLYRCLQWIRLILGFLQFLLAFILTRYGSELTPRAAVCSSQDQSAFLKFALIYSALRRKSI